MVGAVKVKCPRVWSEGWSPYIKSVDKVSETFKGDNLMKIINTIMQTMYEYIKHQDCIRYNSLYKMSKR